MDKLLLLGILLSGGDVFSFKYAGMIFKYAQLIFFIYTVLLIIRNKYMISKYFTKIYLLIVFPHFLSLFYSKYIKSSFTYFIYIFFNYFIVITPILVWCKQKKNEIILEKYIKIFNIIGLLAIIQFILGNVGVYIPFLKNDIYKNVYRPSLWFYEPSYLATFFSIYLGIIMVNYVIDPKKYKTKLVKAWIFIAITTSSTGFIAIFLSFIYINFFSKNKLKNLTISSIYVSICCGGIYFLKPDILRVFVGRLFNQNLQTASGDRIKGIIEAINVFKEYPIFGIGSNAYKYIHYTHKPVTNVTMEIVTNLGLVGFISFSLFFYVLLKKYEENRNNLAIKSMWISLCFFIIILQANQNYMRLYMWIHIAIYVGMLLNQQEKNKREEEN